MNIEACDALHDIQSVASEYGTSIVYDFHTEETVNRDELHMIKSKDTGTQISLKAYPVERKVDEKTLIKAGLREICDIIIWTPLLSWVEAGIIDLDSLGDSFAALDIIRSSIILDGSKWKISDKGLADRIGDVPLYITFGLERN